MKRLFYLMIFVLCFTACEHKELCFQHPHTAQLLVEFDWNYAPDAERDNAVEGMCLWFYPVDEEGTQTGEPLRALRPGGHEGRYGGNSRRPVPSAVLQQ